MGAVGAKLSSTPTSRATTATTTEKDGESDEEQESDVVDEEEEVVEANFFEANFDTNPSDSNE